MSNFITSLIRTYVPILVGSVLSYLVVNYGFVVDDTIANQLVAGLTGFIIALYYAVARLLERKFPQVGTLLLGSSAVPVYVEPTANNKVTTK